MRTLRLFLLLAVLLCAISIGVWMTHGPDRPEGNARAGAAAGDPADEPGGIVHLVVLNGTPVANLAGDFSLLVARAGCVADRIGNASHDGYQASLLVNRRLEDDHAAALAARLGGPVLLREHDARATEDAVLVLGADHERLRDALLSR